MVSCSNCTVNLSSPEDKVNTISLEGLEPARDSSISISTALATIFESYFHNVTLSSTPKSVFLEEDSVFYLCSECSLRLSSLYKSYRQFIQLCQAESLISQKLEILTACKLQTAKREGVLNQDENVSHVKTEPIENTDDFVEPKNDLPHSPIPAITKYEDDCVDSAGEDLGDCQNDVQDNSHPKRTLRPRKISTKKLPSDYSDEEGNYLKNFPSYSDDTNSAKDFVVKTVKPKIRKKRKGKSSLKNSDIKPKKTQIQAIDSNKPSRTRKSVSNNHQCPHCDRVYSRKELLTVHVLSKHNEDAPFACSVCQKKFLLRESLDSHMVIHEDNCPFVCNKCGRKFSRADHLKNHVDKTTCTISRRERLIMSEDPNSRAAIRREMLKKYVVDNDDKNQGKSSKTIYACDKCGKQFSESFTFERHLLTHTEQRLFVCQTCGKAFKYQAALNEHQMVHNDVKKFCCSSCGRRFKRSTHLRAHEKLHADNVPRPYKCTDESCGKTFVWKKNWKQHLNIHFNRSAYVCTFCGKGYPNPSNLRSHERNIHFKNNSSKPNSQIKNLQSELQKSN